MPISEKRKRICPDDIFNQIFPDKYYIMMELKIPDDNKKIPGFIEMSIVRINHIGDGFDNVQLIETITPDPIHLVTRWNDILKYLDAVDIEITESADSEFEISEYTYGFLTWRRLSVLLINHFRTSIGAKMR